MNKYSVQAVPFQVIVTAEEPVEAPTCRLDLPDRTSIDLEVFGPRHGFGWGAWIRQTELGVYVITFSFDGEEKTSLLAAATVAWPFAIYPGWEPKEDEATGMLIEELLDQSTLDYLAKKK